jgi:hypothetical protein
MDLDSKFDGVLEFFDHMQCYLVKLNFYLLSPCQLALDQTIKGKRTSKIIESSL